MPNFIAYIVLALWPVIALGLFSRLSVERATIWTIVGGYMALPPLAAFDLPLIPALDKFTIANLSALLGCMIHAKERVFQLPRSRVVGLLLIAFIASPLATSLTNGDAFMAGPTYVPALRPYDAISIMLGQGLYAIPFFLARSILGTPEAHRDILKIFVAGGLIYSIPMLIEIRLSPQLNVWIYGFFQHQFDQMMRGGGFRPIVFMPHGLMVAFFATSAVIAAATLVRDAAPGQRQKLFGALLYLFVLLVMCKSLAALLYALAVLPLILVLPPRTILWAILVFAVIAMTYPVLRGSGVIPVDDMVAWAQEVAPDRAQSLEFRFANEDVLLDRANERPWFGWGGWGRNQIYDAITGRVVSVLDGRWIIVIGMYGWLGYFAEFGLLTFPLFALFLARRSQATPMIVVGLATILGINMIDNLPNASLLPITWMMAGALLGYVEHGYAAASQTGAAVARPRRAPLQTIL